MVQKMAKPEPDGDVELWVVTDQEKDWSIPVYAEPYTFEKTELYLVFPAIGGLLKRPTDALFDVLDPVCHSNEKDAAGETTGRFWFHRKTLATVAKKAPGVTPKYYFKWDGKREMGTHTKIIAEFKDDEDINPSQEKFLRYICSRVAVLDITQARLLWKAMMQFGSEWLAMWHKPIDFGMFRVIPVPYRKNWKERIYEMATQGKHGTKYIPRTMLRKLKSTKKERDEWVEQNLMPAFYDTSLMEVDPNQYFVAWNLELVESPEFRKYAKNIDTEKRKANRAGRYTQEIIRDITKRLPTIVDALADWCAKVSRPCGARSEQYGSGNPHIVPNRNPDQVLAAIPRPSLIPCVVDAAQLTGPVMETPIKDVRKVYDLLLTNGDVRDGGQGDTTPDNGGMAAPKWVSLHSESESKVEECEVLDVRNNGRPD